MDLVAIGTVESSLVDRASAPKQGSEGAPAAWVAFESRFSDGLDGLAVGDQVFVFTWLHQADREVLQVHPRGDHANPMRGVFSTRAPVRPNPIGLHRVRIVAVDGLRLLVQPLEALNGTPVIDVKPVIRADERPAGGGSE